MRGRMVIVAITLLLLGGGPRPAAACSCAQHTPSEYATFANVVFAGLVTRVSGWPAGLVCSSDSPVAVTFDVETVYKGDVPRTVTVHTVVSGASCGYTFESGKRYTVFARSVEGRFDAGLCRGNVEGAIDPADYGLPAGQPPRN